MRLAVLLFFALVPFVTADTDPKDPKVPVIKEIDKVKVVLPGRGAGANKPTKVTSAEELEKAIPSKEARDELAKQVDFKKQYLLIFSWSGSGGDRLSHSVEKDEVTFSYKRGLTRDLRRHLKIYALAKDAKYKVAG